MHQAHSLSRREALQLAAAWLLGSLAAPTGLAQSRRRIDVHHHWHPPPIADAFAGVDIGPAWEGGVWSVAGALALLDRFGIETAVLSIRNPRRRVTVEKCREVNELAARIVADHPRRFGAFALVPQHDFEQAANEAAYALDTLELDGVLLNASVDRRYLGAAEYEPLMSVLDARNAVVLIHPTTPAYFDELGLDLRSSVIEYVFETTRAMANLIASGSLERHPSVRIIAPHAGGTVPYIAARLHEQMTRFDPELGERAPKGVLEYLRTFYYSTAQATSRYSLAALLELVDSSHVLFGTDLPVSPPALIEESARVLEQHPDLGSNALERIERRNALRLFPRFA